MARFGYPLNYWGDEMQVSIASGLGLDTPLGVIIPALAVVGIWYAMRARSRALLAIAAVVPVQIALILLADTLKRYWFTSRQVTHLAPFLAIVATAGTVWAAKRPARLAIPAFTVLVTLASIPDLSSYYAWVKGNGREMATLIRDRGLDTVYVIPE